MAIRGRRVITPVGERAATVLVRDGLVTGLAEYPAAPDGAITIPGDHVLLPGLVDSHVHVNEPGRTEWEGFASATAAAAAGGVTTIVDMPLNSVPPTVSVAALAAKRAAAAGQLAVDVAFWGGAIPGNVADLRALHEAGVAGFKCFLLPSGVDEFPPLDPGQLGQAMAEIASFGGLLIAHAEDPAVIEAAPAAHGRRYLDFLASRPPAAEVRAIGGLLAQTRRTGCRTHVVHLSSAETLPVIRAAKAAGLPVTAETCPHYLTLAAEDVPDGGTQFKCCPPIRGQANRGALWDGLADGTIDCVVSDHSPCTAELKGLGRSDPAPGDPASVPAGGDPASDDPGGGDPGGGDFGTAWGGIASVQLALPVAWTEAARRGISLSQLAGWMAAAPARLTGLADRGTIAPGQRADFSVFAPDERFVVDPARLLHRNPVSPYAGMTLRGVVHETWLAGERVRPGQRAGRLTAPARASQPAAALSDRDGRARA